MTKVTPPFSGVVFFSFIMKEVRHILRDGRTMLILFGMPVVLMLLFGFAISTDVRNVRTIVVTSNMDHRTGVSIERLAASEYFTLVSTVPSPVEAERMIRHQKADMAECLARTMHQGGDECSSSSMGAIPTWPSNGPPMLSRLF